MRCQYLKIKSKEHESPSFLPCKVIVELWIFERWSPSVDDAVLDSK